MTFYMRVFALISLEGRVNKTRLGDRFIPFAEILRHPSG